MSELTDKIQDKYIDDITSKLPLHRLAMIWLILITKCSYYYNEQVTTLISYLASIKFKDALSINSGPLSLISILDLFSGFILSFIVASLFNSFRKYFFGLQSKLIDFESYIKTLTTKIEKSTSKNSATNYFISRDISTELGTLRSRIKSSNSMSELLFCLMICHFIGIYFFEASDYLSLALMSATLIIMQYFNFKFYIAKFVPFYVTERTLLGSSAKFGDE